MTYRLTGHMMGDPEVYRTKGGGASLGEQPIKRLERHLHTFDHGTQTWSRAAEADGVIADALEFSQSSPEPQPEDALMDIFA
jgi:pyruvate dehydrogenase E1 component alpha subunit